MPGPSSHATAVHARVAPGRTPEPAPRDRCGASRQRPYATNAARSPTATGISAIVTSPATSPIAVAQMMTSPAAASGVRPGRIPRSPGSRRPRPPSVSTMPFFPRSPHRDSPPLLEVAFADPVADGVLALDWPRMPWKSPLAAGDCDADGPAWVARKSRCLPPAEGMMGSVAHGRYLAFALVTVALACAPATSASAQPQCTRDGDSLVCEDGERRLISPEPDASSPLRTWRNWPGHLGGREPGTTEGPGRYGFDGQVCWEHGDHFHCR